MGSKPEASTSSISQKLNWNDARTAKVRPYIDLLISSISDIIKCSTNDKFRKSCFDLMKVDNRQDFEVILRQYVNILMKRRHGLDLDKDSKNKVSEKGLKKNESENKVCSTRIVKENEVIEISDDDSSDDDCNEDEDVNDLKLF